MDIDHLYPAVTVQDDGEEGAARKAVVTLLSYILADPPFIPISRKSKDVIRRHSILDISPEEPEDYLVTDCYPSEYLNTPAKTVQLLRQLNGQVEQLDALHASGDPSVLLRNLRYRSPETDQVLIAVDIGDEKQQKAPLLTILMRLEGEESNESDYKFENLLPAGVDLGEWYSKRSKAVQPPHAGVRTRPPSRLNAPQPDQSVQGRQSSAASQRSIATSVASFHTADAPSDTYDSSNLPTPHMTETNRRSGAGEAEQTSTVEYFTNADDFWSGVKDDDDVDAPEDTEERDADDKAPLHDEEELRRREQEDEDKYWAMYDQQEAHQTDGNENHLQSSAPQATVGNGLNAQAHSIAGATRDEHGTTHATASVSSLSDVSASDRTAMSPLPEDRSRERGSPPQGAHRTMQGDEPAETAQNKVEGPPFADWKEDKNQGGGVLPRSYPAAPESVGGLSYYETPADMSLSDLERMYREKEMQRKADARKRIQRAVYGDAIAEEDDVQSASQPSAGGFPGLRFDEKPRKEGEATSCANRTHDPIQALAFAEHNVAVADESQKKGKAAVPRSASMETLRKLAEEQEASSGWKGKSDAAEQSSMSGSRTGGFKNFLQMAPSVVTDSDTWDMQSTTGTSVVRLPEAVVEEDDGQEDNDDVSTKTEHSDKSRVSTQSKDHRNMSDLTADRPHATGPNMSSPDHHRSTQPLSMDDLEAFMFPGREEKGRKEETIEEEPAGAVRTAKGVISRGSAQDSDQAREKPPSIGPSDTFFDDATSAAAVPGRAVQGVALHRPLDAGTPPGKDLESNDVDTNSTSTNYPGIGAPPRGAFNKSNTAGLMQEHLRQQRQQALQMQRERQEQLRQSRLQKHRGSRNVASKAVKVVNPRLAAHTSTPKAAPSNILSPTSTTDKSSIPSSLFSPNQTSTEADAEIGEVDEDAKMKERNDGPEEMDHEEEVHDEVERDESDGDDGVVGRRQEEDEQGWGTGNGEEYRKSEDERSTSNAQSTARPVHKDDTRVSVEESQDDTPSEQALPFGGIARQQRNGQADDAEDVRESTVSDDGDERENFASGDESSSHRDILEPAPPCMPSGLVRANSAEDEVEKAQLLSALPNDVAPPLDAASSVGADKESSIVNGASDGGREQEEGDGRENSILESVNEQEQHDARATDILHSASTALVPAVKGVGGGQDTGEKDAVPAHNEGGSNGADKAKTRNVLDVQQNTAHQQDRANAARLAKRRREYAQGIKARNESVKMILKGAWRLMDETAAAMEGSHASDGVERMGESEFLRLAREAVREGLQEKRSVFS